MLSFVQKRWFVLSLLVLITGGLSTGSVASDATIESLTGRIHPRAVTALVLFLMSFSLNSGQLKASLQSPRPVLWASAVNYGMIPVMAWVLMHVQLNDDFAIGLMIAGSVPCTMAAASVWTRKAGGNDAVSLLVTVLTNGGCFVLTPLWLNLATIGGVGLDATQMMYRLVIAVLLPTLAGQAIRLVPRASTFATTYKTPIGVVAQSCILALVFKAACGAGTRLQGTGLAENLGGFLWVWVCCIVIHLAAMAIGLFGARRFGFSTEDRAAVAFASSQKTLPIGVLLATDVTMFGNPDLLGIGVGVPFAVFPMLMYHASQLFIDTAVADRLAAQKNAERAV